MAAQVKLSRILMGASRQAGLWVQGASTYILLVKSRVCDGVVANTTDDAAAAAAHRPTARSEWLLAMTAKGG